MKYRRYADVALVTAVVICLGACGRPSESGSVDFGTTFDVAFSIEFTVYPGGESKLVAAPWLGASNPLLLVVGKGSVANLERLVDETIGSFFDNIVDQMNEDIEAVDRDVTKPILQRLDLKLVGETNPTGTKLLRGTATVNSDWEFFSGRQESMSHTRDVSDLDLHGTYWGQIKTVSCFEAEESMPNKCTCTGYFCYGTCTACPELVKWFGFCWTVECKWSIAFWECRCKPEHAVPCPCE